MLNFLLLSNCVNFKKKFMEKIKTRYVDGFVLIVPKKNVSAYKKMAKEGCETWMKYGALSYRECMLNDAKPPMIELTFPKMVNAKPSETVWFSYIEYKNKKHRDEVNKKVMAEMDKKAEKYKDFKMPFDMKKMSFGGFEVVVSD